jgi:hypothetical protein
MAVEEQLDIKRRIQDIEEELEQLRSAIPAHSLKPEMLMRIEELEDELDELRKKEN